MDENGEPAVLNASKAKFDKFLEDIRLREAADGVPGTFGDGTNTFNFGQFHQVDSNCELKGVSVMHDFSCVLIQEDISYNNLPRLRYTKCSY